MSLPFACVPIARAIISVEASLIKEEVRALNEAQVLLSMALPQLWHKSADQVTPICGGRVQEWELIWRVHPHWSMITPRSTVRAHITNNAYLYSLFRRLWGSLCMFRCRRSRFLHWIWEHVTPRGHSSLKFRTETKSTVKLRYDKKAKEKFLNLH